MNKKILVLVLYCAAFNSIAQSSFSELVNETEKSVVLIQTYDEFGNIKGLGSGFFIDDHGTIISNYHIFKEAYDAIIFTNSKSSYYIDTIIMSSEQFDLVKFVLKNPKADIFKGLKTAKEYPVKGQDIYVIGNPEGLENSVSRGIISNIHDTKNHGTIFQITTPLSPGSSGSPVCNLSGEVFGIATSMIEEGQNLNFAIDIRLLESVHSNDAFLLKISAEKKLPNDRQEAVKLIDSIQIKPKERLKFLNEFIKKYPNDYYGYLQRARFFSNEFIAILAMYDPDQQSVEEIPDIQKSAWFKADKDFSFALTLSPTNQMIYYYRGMARFQFTEENELFIAGWDYLGALADLELCSSLETGCDLQWAFYYKGLCYKRLNRISEAQSTFNRAKNFNCDMAEGGQAYIYYELAYIKSKSLKDDKNALLDLNRAIQIAENKPVYETYGIPEKMIRLRADIEYNEGDLVAALRDFQYVNNSAGSLSPEGKNSYSYLMEGSIIMELDGDPASAIKAYTTALDLSANPEDELWAFVYKKRSLARYKNEDYFNALTDINKYFQLEKSSNYSAFDYEFRSLIKSGLNDNIGALNDINIAINMELKNANYYFTKGRILWRLDDNFGAEKAFDKAIELNPTDPEYYYYRGWLKLSTNKSGACADWSKAGELGKIEVYQDIQQYCK
jgi:tetratricopeptide (TPR) repeat protein